MISGILPAQVTVPFADLTSLTLIGAGRLDTLNVNANKRGPVNVVPSAGVGNGTVTSALPVKVTYENMAAVNVTNAADLPLDDPEQYGHHHDGRPAIEGKSVPYLVTSFLDSDVNARSSNFTATINWGDGSPTVPGSISSQGFVRNLPQFAVTASHNYHEAGTYTVSVTLVDLGTAAVPSILGGIPVTVTDLGSTPARISSVAQVNLVSNGVIPAAHTDANLVDAWGIAEGSSGPFWVGDRGTGLATVYNSAGVPQPPVVTIPPPAAARRRRRRRAWPSTRNSARCRPCSTWYRATRPPRPNSSSPPLNGTISGWNASVSASSCRSSKWTTRQPAPIYTGLAVADNGGSDVSLRGQLPFRHGRGVRPELQPGRLVHRRHASGRLCAL